MSEILDPPIQVQSSVTGVGSKITIVTCSEGRYEIMNMHSSISANYAQKTSLGFRYKNADQSFTYQRLKCGWSLASQNLIVEGSREIVGPGDFYASALFDASGMITLNLTYRRLRD